MLFNNEDASLGECEYWNETQLQRLRDNLTDIYIMYVAVMLSLLTQIYKQKYYN